MRRRVVVTGVGAVTPLGIGAEALGEGLLAGRSGVGMLTLFDPAELPTRVAAQVPLGDEALGFRDRKIAFAVMAAEEAFSQSRACGSEPGGALGGQGAGVSLGVGLEVFSMQDMVAQRHGGAQVPSDRRARLTFLQTPSDLCVHLVSQVIGARAAPITHVSACAAGTDAIGVAFRLVASGRRRWMLAGGADSMINPLGVAGFSKLGATSPSWEEPQKVSRPFDRRRNGFVLGEGAGALVLEAREDALARGAQILAEIVGYGCSFDAHGISEPHPDGRGAWQAMVRAVADAGIEPGDIDAVNAHGTSTPKNGPMETLALKRLLGDRAWSVPISAPKSMIGHLISAAGAVEAVGAIHGMRAGRVHPTINLDEPDPLCDLDYVPHVARSVEQRHVLSTSFAFGGQNAAIVLRRHEPDVL